MTSLIWPNGSTTRPRVTSDFNPNRKHPVTGKVQPHRGIDLAGWRDIVSPVAGRVTTKAYQAGGAGYYVNITEDGTGAVFKFFHLAMPSSLKVGDRVKPGTYIGQMGKSGTATGVHLHYEVWVGGKVQNPTTFYNQRGLSATPATPGDDMTPQQYQTLLDTQKAVAEMHRLLGAGGALNVIGPQDNAKTMGYQMRDVQMALTTALPLLLNAAAAEEREPEEIAKAVAASLPDDIGERVLKLLSERIGATA